MKIAKYVLFSTALVLLSVILISGPAKAETYVTFRCIADKADLAYWRAACDEDAELSGFMHGTLRVVNPQRDPIDPAQMGCVKNDYLGAYICIGVPSEIPGTTSYIWTHEND